MLTVACLPAYNEEQKIYDIVKRTAKFVDKVVVCDDGSNDQTCENAEKAGAVVLKHSTNKGKGAAMRTLFDYAKKIDGDIIITMDSDAQFLPEEIPKLVNSLIENKADIVTGYRFADEKDMPAYRKFGNKVLDKVTNLATEIPVRDTQSGFRAYSKKAINSIKFATDGFGADSEILISASRKGLKILEEPVTVIYNTQGKTSTKDPVTHSASVITTLIELIAIKQPLRYLGIPGFILIVIGIIYSMVVIAIFNDTRYFSVPSTLVALGSLTIGILLLLMSAVLYSINRGTRYARTHMD